MYGLVAHCFKKLVLKNHVATSDFQSEDSFLEFKVSIRMQKKGDFRTLEPNFQHQNYLGFTENNQKTSNKQQTGQHNVKTNLISTKIACLVACGTGS